MEFMKEHDVNIVASLPCYTEENVRKQRGRGVFEKSIEVLRRLNALGYAREGGPTLDLVYNPGGPSLPGEQSVLENAYKEELRNNFGIEFNRLFTITNMPIGRFQSQLERQGQAEDYMDKLVGAFNPGTLEGLMCRWQISIDWDGTLYDCDFNLALGLSANHGVPDHIDYFNPRIHGTRRIRTGRHCYGCTAGHGSSCGGALE